MPKPTSVFSALANKTRLDILLALHKHEMNVSELIKELGVQQSAISHNLKKLASAGLVSIRRQKKFTFAALDRAKADLIMQLLKSSTGQLDKKAARIFENTETTSKRLVDVLPVPAIIVQGAEVYFANRLAVTLFGYESRRQLIGKKVTGMLDAEATLLILKRRQALLQGRPVSPAEHNIIRRDGSPVTVESHVTLVKLNGDYGFFIAFRDLTRQKEKEANICEHAKWLRQIADTAACAVMVTDKDDTIVYGNERLASFLGQDVKAIQGKKFHSFLWPQGKPKVLKFIRMLRQGRGGTFETVIHPLKAKPLKIHFSAGPLYDELGKYWGQLSIIMESKTQGRLIGPPRRR